METLLLARGLCQAFSTPAQGRGQTAARVHIWHCHFLDVTLGK